jgi:signal transduction histidine kinase
LQHIIEDTLDLAMIESGQLKIRRTQKKIADYFSELDSEIQQLYSNSNVGVVKVIDENIESEMLSMDHTKLNQIFFNLIKNAIKYTPSGFVHYGISNYTRHMVEFFVEDTGVGIDPQYHELIFKSFRQINDGISREHGGLGLGLAIIKGLVEYMGGKVRVVSELNQGATFYFNLPH